MKEIVVQHNDLVEMPLKGFSAIETDIFTSICFAVQEKGENEIRLNFNQLKELAAFKSKDEKRFSEELAIINKKLMGLSIRTGTERRIVQFAAFPKFVIDLDEKCLEVKVAEEFIYLLNNLSNNYTAWELKKLTSLNSFYSKNIYKKLRQYKKTGFWRVSIEEFRNYLDIPESYDIRKISQKVIEPAIKELSEYYKNLKYEKEYDKSGGMGRPKIARFLFTFKKQTDDEIDECSYLPINRYCPVCKKEVFAKTCYGDEGNYMIYGHKDYITGDCNWASNDISKTLTLKEVKEQTTEEENLPEEEKSRRQEMKKRIDEITKRIVDK